MSPSGLNLWLGSDLRPPLVMGVINLTPDSFSDGGRLSGPDQAADYAQQLVDAGADWLDVGGESTRPGALVVPPQEQIRRTIPAIAAIRRRLDVVISIDTTNAQVAQQAVDSGANVVNDVSAGRNDPEMIPLVARLRLPVVLMHMQGDPQTMQLAPSYRDVTAEVSAFLLHRRDQAVLAGIDPGRILLDPGIGFGKTTAHDLQLLRDTSALAKLGHPLLVGPSRKRFIGEITGERRPDQRVFGTAAVVAWCVADGAAVVRVHDVGPISQVVRMIRAISSQNKPRIS
ncbi:MAG: dihydropteroate synthase [Tepidisphaeraceae bacterium]|jgi:dihydropteroate synthase